jgi:hypothetical protein
MITRVLNAGARAAADAASLDTPQEIIVPPLGTPGFAET